MNQTIDVVEWLQERAFRMYGPTMEAAHTKTKEWLWADEITRLRADLTAALAECERLIKSRNRWGKKYNDCLGKLRLAVMSDSDYVKEIDYQNTRLRAENKKLREALNFAVQALEYYQNPYDIAQAVPDFYSELGFGDEAEDTLDEINKLLNS